LPQKPEIKYILAMHSHFDHVCGIPMLKRLFPSARTAGSARTQKLLESEKVQIMLKRADATVSAAYLQSGLLSEKPDDLDTDLLGIDLCLGEGDSLTLDNGLTIDIMETPGHTPCSLSAYVAQDQAMFVSDAAGYCSGNGIISPVFFQDYRLYINSIRRIMDFPVDILGFGHGEICKGQQVQDYFQNSLKAAQESFAAIKAGLEEGRSEEELGRELFDKYINGALAYYPEDMMLASMQQLIKSVKNCM